MFDCPFLTRWYLKSFSVTNFIEAIETNKITPYFVDSLWSLKGLTCLDLSFSCISDFLLCSLALDALPLTKLVLHGCFHYTYYRIYRLLSKSSFLQHLDLQAAMFLNDHRINELCAFLGDLVSINVNGCDKLTNAAFFALLRNCPFLSEIHMESTQLGIGSRPSLNLVVYHQLKSLHLANNSHLQDEDINMFAFTFPNMQLLDLSSCDDICIGKVSKICCNIRHLNSPSVHELSYFRPTLNLPIWRW
ncbi:putative leucine-rich repeat domain, L domain-containing protein [Medicago truncatula]|uniref:Putative leucine-rich repeat domain, L domain-containing protein n=1 Tax=Medicago truncatula TaxID=3880 RepID=A0A396ITJ0_MEDTR|nr:putative leucine-rich repeat domain, L domain-containing protein [Medicago truncatula]